MDDDKDKRRKGPGGKGGGRGKSGAGRPERPARWPGPRRDGPPAANDSRREAPRKFKDFKSKGPRPSKDKSTRPEGAGSSEPRPGRRERERNAPGEGRRQQAASRSGERPKRQFQPRAPRHSSGDDRGFGPGEGKDRPRFAGKPGLRDTAGFGDRARPGDKDRNDRRPDAGRREGGTRETGGDAHGRRHSGDRVPRRGFDDRPPRAASGGDRPFKPRNDRPRFEDRGRGDRSDRAARPEGEGHAEGERIAKRLARAGIASRRDAEALIAAGRVKVNGRALTTPAHNVLSSDTIEVDGTEIPPVERTRVFLFHKPAGVVTTNRDPEGRRTVFDVLPPDLPRLITVGRLDINTEGLLLLTNDGGLARVLELPATGWLRRYRVRVHGHVDETALKGLKDGVAVDGVFYGAIEASLEREQGSNAWLMVGLREGKNREVKNVLGAMGMEVTRLIRVSFGPFQLGELPEGAVLELKGKMLRDQLGPRLIEESGANFDAPVVKPFSNSPVRGRPDRDREDQKPRGERRAEPIGEGGLIKRRKAREEGRDRALSQLDTRPHRGKGPHKGGDKGGFGGPGKGRKGEREAPLPSSPRKANVWMAPGARPRGGKDSAKGESGSREGGDGRPRGPRKGGGADRRR
ncbi:MAG: pseudouridine synthase [Rhizobiaceae bacterium]